MSELKQFFSVPHGYHIGIHFCERLVFQKIFALKELEYSIRLVYLRIKILQIFPCKHILGIHEKDLCTENEDSKEKKLRFGVTAD